ATKRHKSSGNHLYSWCFFVAILLLRQSRVTPVRDTKRQSVFQWSRLPRRHKLSQSSNISPPAHRIILTQIALTAYLFLGRHEFADYFSKTQNACLSATGNVDDQAFELRRLKLSDQSKQRRRQVFDVKKVSRLITRSGKPGRLFRSGQFLVKLPNQKTALGWTKD